jgi:hypothetical protein
MKSKTSTKNTKQSKNGIGNSTSKTSTFKVRDWRPMRTGPDTIHTMTVRVSMDKDGNITGIERIRIGKEKTS